MGQKQGRFELLCRSTKGEFAVAVSVRSICALTTALTPKLALPDKKPVDKTNFSYTLSYTLLSF